MHARCVIDNAYLCRYCQSGRRDGPAGEEPLLMGDFVETSTLKVGDVFRHIGHRGAIGRPRRVTAVRTLQGTETHTVVESVNPQSEIGETRVRDGSIVERVSPITYGEAMDALSLMAHGDVLYFVAFDGRLYA